MGSGFGPEAPYGSPTSPPGGGPPAPGPPMPGMPAYGPAYGSPGYGPATPGPSPSGPAAYPPPAYGSPAAGPTAGGRPPAPPGPPARRRSALLPVLVALGVLLLIGEVALLVVSNRSLGSLDKELAVQKEQAAKDAAERDKTKAAQDALAAGAAALPAKLTAVKSADQAVADAIKKWETVDSTKFGTVIDSIEACYLAVDTYNRAAAVVPASALPAGVPAVIDLKAPATDCSRSSLGGL